MPSMWEAGMGRDREGPKNFGYIFVSAIKPFPLCSDAWLLHGSQGAFLRRISCRLLLLPTASLVFLRSRNLV